MKKTLKGLLLTGLIAVVSTLVHDYVFRGIETLTIGILLAMITANLFSLPAYYDQGIQFASKKMLKWGIVLLGVNLNFNLIMSLGPKLLLLIICLISLALTSAYLLGKIQGLSPRLSVLLGVGSSICGASAIVAMGPVIDADEEDMAISVAVISILGAIGVLLYTFLGDRLPLSDLEYGIWSGSSLQGVAHALAAAGARGTDSLSLEIGTLVKMARVTFLAPVALILSALFRQPGKRSKVKFPTYVLYFILVGVLFTLNDIYHLLPLVVDLGPISIEIPWILKKASSILILMAMVAMGLKVNFRTIDAKANKAFLVGSFVFALLSLVSLAVVQGLHL